MVWIVGVRIFRPGGKPVSSLIRIPACTGMTTFAGDSKGFDHAGGLPANHRSMRSKASLITADSPPKDIRR